MHLDKWFDFYVAEFDSNSEHKPIVCSEFNFILKKKSGGFLCDENFGLIQSYGIYIQLV